MKLKEKRSKSKEKRTKRKKLLMMNAHIVKGNATNPTDYSIANAYFVRHASLKNLLTMHQTKINFHLSVVVVSWLVSLI